MKRLTTKVTYKVPIGPYCNHDNKKSTPLTRCRFCTDLGKYGFTCVLHNEQLASMGVLINKCDSCMKKQGVVEDVPTVPPKDLMTYAVKTYRKLYQDLLRQGFPEPIADKMAQEGVLK